MKIILVGQEEPVYFGPFFRTLLKARANDIKAVVIAGDRGAGSHPKTFKEKLKNLYSLWLLFEAKGFLRNLRIKLFQKLLGALGLTGTKVDKRSIQGLAKELGIPVIHTDDINAPSFIEKLKKYKPDIILNQSELLLKKPFLEIPNIGVLNRHASLLPRFRGRVGSFWAHAEKNPEYGTTIHFVDESIDSGPIIAQKTYNLDPRMSYTCVLDTLFKTSTGLVLEALKNLESPNFKTLPNKHLGTKTYKFPTLEQIQAYRQTLNDRRKS